MKIRIEHILEVRTHKLKKKTVSKKKVYIWPEKRIILDRLWLDKGETD